MRMRRLLATRPGAHAYLRCEGERCIAPERFVIDLAVASRHGLERRIVQAREGARGKLEATKCIHVGAKRISAKWRPEAARLRWSPVVFEATGTGRQRTTQNASEVFAAVAAHWAPRAARSAA